MKIDKLWVNSWIMLILTLGFLGGCGATIEPSPTPPVVPTQLPTDTPVPTATPTQAPTLTPQPKAEVVLVILDCTVAFCIPAELEQQVKRVDSRPGIIGAVFVGEYHVRLDYDPTQLAQEEAVQIFGSATGFEVEVIE